MPVTVNVTNIDVNTVNETVLPYFDDGVGVVNWIFISLFIVNLICGVLGNTMVIYICGYKLREKKHKIIKIIFMLGIIDLVSSISNPTLFIYLIYNKYYYWHFGVFGCKLLKSIGPISTTASSGLILFMAIDRYRAIVTPTKQQFKKKTVYWTGAGIVLLAILSHIPYMTYLDHNGNQCIVIDTHGIYYHIDIVIIILWDLSVLIVFIITGIAIRCALDQTTSKIEQSLTGRQLQNVKRRDQRVNRLIIAVCIVFLICIIPRDILHIFFGIQTILKKEYKVTETILNINAMLKLLSTMNSSINVFLYARFNHWFQKEILKILVNKTFFGRCQRCHDLLIFYESRSSDRRNSRPSLVPQSTIESNL